MREGEKEIRREGEKGRREGEREKEMLKNNKH